MTREAYFKHKDLIEAWANGAEIEVKTISGNWEYVAEPDWLVNNEYRIKLEKHELRKGQYYVDDELEVVRYIDEQDNKKRIEAGLERQTKEEAEDLAKHLRRVARLHALASELGGLREFIEGVENYYIYKEDDEWETTDSATYYPETVYMTRECAKKICELLNREEFEL